MRSNCVLLSLMLVFALGCGRSNETAVSTTGDFSDQDIERFLKIVADFDTPRLPSFSPPENDGEPDYSLPAAEIVQEFQTKLRVVLDADRQGKVWNADPEWQAIFKRHRVDGVQFANWNRRVTLAVLRVRFEAHGEVGRLAANSRRETSRLLKIVEQVDKVPADQRTRDARALRATTSVELAMAAALAEYAVCVEQVPEEDAALVRKYSKQLKPLIPKGTNDDLLAEFRRVAKGRESSIEQVGYEKEEPSKPRKAKRPAKAKAN